MLDQLVGVFRFLVLERHRMNDAFNIISCSLASGLFRKFRKRAGSRHEEVDQVTTHRSGNSAESTDGDTIFGFSLFELLDGLAGCPHFLADLPLAEAESLTHRSDPSA